MAAEIQKKMQKEWEACAALQKEYQKVVVQKQQLESQLNENTTVKEELMLLKKDSEVYKLIGPVLIKQELEEARLTVAKRMEYISKEIKRADVHISALDNKLEAVQSNLNKLKSELASCK